MPIEVMQEAGRPNVQFYWHPIQRQGKRKGSAYWEDVEYCKITPPGGNLVVEKEVTEEVINRFRPEYEAWKRQEETPTVGMPLKMWPPATPGFVKTCAALDIKSVEQLAGISDTVLNKLGPGARNWKTQAQQFMEDAERGVNAELVAELQAKIQQLEERCAELEKSNAGLKAIAEAKAA